MVQSENFIRRDRYTPLFDAFLSLFGSKPAKCEKHNAFLVETNFIFFSNFSLDQIDSLLLTCQLWFAAKPQIKEHKFALMYKCYFAEHRSNRTRAKVSNIKGLKCDLRINKIENIRKNSI
jgi:hypothetical protein